MTIHYINENDVKEVIKDAMGLAIKDLVGSRLRLIDVLDTLSPKDQEAVWNWMMAHAFIEIHSPTDLPEGTKVTLQVDGWRGKTIFKLHERDEVDEAEGEVRDKVQWGSVVTK